MDAQKKMNAQHSEHTKSPRENVRSSPPHWRSRERTTCGNIKIVLPCQIQGPSLNEAPPRGSFHILCTLKYHDTEQTIYIVTTTLLGKDARPTTSAPFAARRVKTNSCCVWFFNTERCRATYSPAFARSSVLRLPAAIFSSARLPAASIAAIAAGGGIARIGLRLVGDAITPRNVGVAPAGRGGHLAALPHDPSGDALQAVRAAEVDQLEEGPTVGPDSGLAHQVVDLWVHVQAHAVRRKGQENKRRNSVHERAINFFQKPLHIMATRRSLLAADEQTPCGDQGRLVSTDRRGYKGADCTRMEKSRPALGVMTTSHETTTHKNKHNSQASKRGRRRLEQNKRRAAPSRASERNDRPRLTYAPPRPPI